MASDGSKQPLLSQYINYMKKLQFFFLLLILSTNLPAQDKWDSAIEAILPDVLKTHRQFVSMPNVAANADDIHKNLDWVSQEFFSRLFKVRLLESETLPVFLAERTVDPKAKTILFYLHLDGQPVDASRWDQEDPFVPVLKAQNNAGNWERIDWNKLDGPIDLDWRIFGRAAADDKAPIMMMLTALDLLAQEGLAPNFNVKVVLDCQEEAGSEAFLSTLEKYKKDYAADYLLIMDGPAHPSNLPTLTFGCRGIASCSITTYGAKLPQHSGHYGNYAPNPVFVMSNLLASMKNEQGKVLIKDYYKGIKIDKKTAAVFAKIPDDEEDIQQGLGIHTPDQVGKTYQEALQYPSLNVRHIETSWKGPGLKTVIPEFMTAYLDVRLVAETDGAQQLAKIKKHIQEQGFHVLDRAPSDAERLQYPRIATFKGDPGVNAFRTDMNAGIGQQLATTLEAAFGQAPVKIRTMGGTVPIIEAINTLDIPAIIVPMVNMDNNQHNPNENIRIGNIRDGIRMCIEILRMDLE
jgi:acetylornithine deacetylase/succinyl-diaminopimelate desuccinylase-like protein